VETATLQPGEATAQDDDIDKLMAFFLFNDREPALCSVLGWKHLSQGAHL